jgi:Protein of unknown function (DUF2800).
MEVVPRQHALLSASSAERWLTCTPSARMEEALPDRGSAYASDGTAAHAFAELRLRYLLKQITKKEYLKGYEATKALHAEPLAEWEVSDWEAINSYVDYVMSEAKRLDADVLIEQRVDYSKYAQGGFGTSDALLYSEAQSTIKSIDLKFGKGVPVSATNNPQAKLYALGGLIALDPDHRVKNVEWAIVQPRLNYIGEDSTTSKELIHWAETVVAPAAELAWEGKGDLKPTTKGCHFCKARAICRARIAENVLIARRDFMPTPDPRLEERLMTMGEVGRILPDLDGWISWANALKAYALEQARDHGAEIPGYKLVRGRAVRSWNPDADVAAELLSTGVVSETVMYTEPSLKSVAQMEKAMGKKNFATVEAKLVVKPLGTPALVPESDPREAIDKVAEAAKAFAADK